WKHFYNNYMSVTGDLGLSKSSTAISDADDDEIYGIILYVTPKVFQGQNYTKASDVYGFGMIMWKFMTGRRPFWNRVHDVNLIIDICDGLRPLIVKNAPEGYIELMQDCWHSNPKRKPTAADIQSIFQSIKGSEYTKANNGSLTISL
ncbi:716_t:CDS:2, partial [Funneliformis geosporum]